MRVLRVYHGGRDPSHRARERALAALGIDLTLVVPTRWPESGAEAHLSPEPFRVVQLGVDRPGDVNRHRYRDRSALRRLVEDCRPDVLDVHEEPFSVAARQWIHAAGDVPITMYTAQNVDKRFPPPFAQYEAAAYRRVAALYPCSRQAASVARGKGFAGLIDVMPLGVEDVWQPGPQSAGDDEVRLGIVGRLVPEKGVQDAVRVLASIAGSRPARLVVIGDGPEAGPARALARDLGLEAQVEFRPWQRLDSLASLYRQLHVVLVPSRATGTWVEQFGRIILEGQASGAIIAGYRSGAIPEVAGDAAILRPEGAVEELASAVRAVLGDPSRYADLRQRGLHAAARATWSSVAVRQARLYERVAAGEVAPLPLPSRAHCRRHVAVEEFGPPARLAGGSPRPFALPGLRRDARWTRAVASTVDGVVRALGR